MMIPSATAPVFTQQTQFCSNLVGGMIRTHISKLRESNVANNSLVSVFTEDTVSVSAADGYPDLDTYLLSNWKFRDADSDAGLRGATNQIAAMGISNPADRTLLSDSLIKSFQVNTRTSFMLIDLSVFNGPSPQKPSAPRRRLMMMYMHGFHPIVCDASEQAAPPQPAKKPSPFAPFQQPSRLGAGIAKKPAPIQVRSAATSGTIRYGSAGSPPSTASTPASPVLVVRAASNIASSIQKQQQQQQVDAVKDAELFALPAVNPKQAAGKSTVVSDVLNWIKTEIAPRYKYFAMKRTIVSPPAAAAAKKQPPPQPQQQTSAVAATVTVTATTPGDQYIVVQRAPAAEVAAQEAPAPAPPSEGKKKAPAAKSSKQQQQQPVAAAEAEPVVQQDAVELSSGASIVITSTAPAAAGKKKASGGRGSKSHQNRETAAAESAPPAADSATSADAMQDE
jgi:hypothetical protein